MLDFKIAILNVLRHKECQCAIYVKFRQNRSNGCGDIAILRFSKMVAETILDLYKFKFLRAGTFASPNLRHCAKFHQDQSIHC